LWLRIPLALLFGLVIFIDVVQIPFYYHLYEQGSDFLEKSTMFRKWMKRDWSSWAFGKLAMRLGGLGVLFVAALPTFGGGMWSATFIAYGLGLQRRAGYAWMILGSVLSYATLYWVLDTLIRTLRYFIQ